MTTLPPKRRSAPRLARSATRRYATGPTNRHRGLPLDSLDLHNDTRPLRVLILTSEAPPVISGISTTIATLRAGLERRGHHVDVVSRADFPRLVRREIRLSAFGLFWPSFRRMLSRYDVVNVHGPVPTMSELFMSLIGTLPIGHRPAVVYTHHSDLAIPGLDRYCGWYNRAMGRLAHAADEIVVTSEAYQGKLRRATGAPVHVIPWALDVADQVVPRQRPTTPDALEVLFVGQLRPYKGLDQLLSAVAGRPELRLTVVGDGPMRADLARRILHEGLGNVRLIGRVTETDKWQHYADADVIVLPSTTTAEAFGLVLLEGMAAGCVPVASDLPGVRTVAGYTGVVTEPGNVDELRDCLVSLAQDRVRLGELADLSGLYAGEQGLDTMVSAYERVLSRARASTTARQAASATPRGFDSPQDFMGAVAAASGTSHVSISLLAGDGRHARIWRYDAGDVPLTEAPVATHVSRTGRPILIQGTTATDPGLAAQLHRPDVRSSMLLPFRGQGGAEMVLGVSHHSDSEGSLDHRDLAKVVALLDLRTGVTAGGTVSRTTRLAS